MQLGSFQLPTRWKHYKFPVIQLHFLRRWNNSQANRACLSSWRREKIHLETESPCIISPRSFVRSFINACVTRALPFSPFFFEKKLHRSAGLLIKDVAVEDPRTKKGTSFSIFVLQYSNVSSSNHGGGGGRWVDIGKPDLSRCTYTSSWLPQGWWMLHTKRWSFEQSMIRHSRSGHGCLVTTRVHIDPPPSNGRMLVARGKRNGSVVRPTKETTEINHSMKK